MKGKQHIPALWPDASNFCPNMKNLFLRFSFAILLFTVIAQTARAHDWDKKNTVVPTLTLESAGPDSAACGDTITVTIAAISGFTDIGTLQYSINWDETQLMFISDSALQIGGVGGEPLLGTGNTANGELTYSWIDPAGLDGEDLSDSTVLLILKFKVITSSGTASVDITDNPLMMEVADNLLATGTVVPQNNADVVIGPVFVTLEFSDDEVCPNDTAFVLTGGLPTGGTFSGPGVSNDSIFNASVAGPGEHIITYTFIDTITGCANSATDTITVGDTEPPVITCPIAAVSDFANDSCEYQFLGIGLDASATDNCALDSIVNDWTNTATLDSAIFPIGVTVVTWTAVDSAGLTATCTVEVTVSDTTSPTIICPANVTVGTDTLVCNAAVNGIGATASDNCSFNVTWSQTGGPALIDPGTSTLSDASGAVFDLGTTTIEYVVTDTAGNTATCSFTVTVEDDEIFVVTPVPSPPNPVVFQDTFNVVNAPGTCSQSVSWYRASFLTHVVTDNCPLGTYVIVEGDAIVNGTPDPNFLSNSGVTPLPYDFTNILHQVTPVSAAFPIGTTVIPYYFIDNNSDTVTIPVVVNVEDTEPPMASCVSDTVELALDNSGNAVLLPNQVDNGSMDNCGIDSIAVEPDSFDCADVGVLQTVVLTVFDIYGNSDTCSVLVSIVDEEPPVVFCPTDRVLTADTNCVASDPTLGMVQENDLNDLGPGEFFDNAGVCGSGLYTVTYSVNGGLSKPIDSLPTEMFALGLSTVVIQVDDGFSPPVSCSFSVTVEDEIPPTTANCPNPAPVNANLGGCQANVTWTLPTFTDNCPGNVFVISTHAPGSTFFFDSTLVTYTATDAAGNIGVCSFYVVVNDLQPPVANCQDVTVLLDANGEAEVVPAQLDNGSTDNCFYEYVTDTITYNCSNIGANNYTFTVSDGAGNLDSVVCVVTVADTSLPVITNCSTFVAPAVELDAACFATLDAATYAQNFIITDNTQNSTPTCPFTFEIDVDGNGFSADFQFNCSHAGARTVTFRVTDVFGNSAVCTTTVEVNDVTPPVIINADTVAPPNVSIGCGAFNPVDFDVLGEITLADVQDACDDSCAVAIDIDFDDDITPDPLCVNNFTIVRTWTVTDQAGNTATHTQTITVGDTEAPTISGLVSPVILEANNLTETPACAVEQTLEILPANVSDDCTDDFNDFLITYEIDFAPLGVGANVSDTGAVVTEVFPIGVSEVIFTVTDPCGNASQDTITVVVNDVDAPIADEPFGSFFGNVQNVCGQSFTILNATGNCGNNFSWYRPYSNANEEDFLDCSPYSVTETISDPTVQSAINVSTPFVYNNPPVFSIFPTTFFPVGETTVTYTATDSAGNSATCAFVVKIVDNEPPTIACPGDQELSITNGCTGATLVPNFLNGVQVTDNCPNGVVLTQSPVADTLLADVIPLVEPGQTFVVTVTAQDSFPDNLSATPCTFTVTLVDNEAPVPVLPFLPDIITTCGLDTIEAPLALDCNGTEFDTIYGTPSVTVVDILPPLVPGGPPRYVLNAGNYAITWSYTDPENNTTTQLQSVEVGIDNNPPIAICQDSITINLNASGQYFLTTAEIDNGSSDPDNCGPVQLGVTPTLLNCSNLGTLVSAILLVQDVAGNTAQCSTVVTVLDVTAPVLSPIPPNDTLEACVPIPDPAVVTAQDTCDADVTVTYVQDTVTFVNAYQYTIIRTWTATDDSGNATTGTQLIAVEDTQAPVITGAPDTLFVLLDLNNLDCQDTAQFDITPFVEDCDSTTLTITNSRTNQGAAYEEILSIGEYPLVFTATDGNGNVTTHSMVVVVRDVVDPIAACINGVSISLQASGTVIVTTAQINANSSDNCTQQPDLVLQIQRLDPLGQPGSSIVFDCSDADGVTQHPVRLIVIDESGNEATCETFIVVQDNVAPTITSCPPSRTLNCDADFSPLAQGIAVANDNCLLDTLTYSDDTLPGTPNFCFQIARTWLAIDQAGNSVTCVQTFSVQDTVAPAFSSLPGNANIGCSDSLTTAPALTATDNCDDNVEVVLTVDTIDVGQGNCGQFNYTVRRTWTATDNCGNTSVHTQEVTVSDTEAPLFTGAPDTITVFSADFPANQNCTVPVPLDITQFVSDCQPDDFIVITNNAPQGNGAAVISGDYTVGVYTVQFTATDACGNAATYTLVVNVVDNSIPTAICNDNVVIALGTNGEATLSPDDVNIGSNDNCGIDSMYLSQADFDCSHLGINTISLTVVDSSGNSNSCTVDVNVTPGDNDFFTLTTSSTPESFAGANDGTATATPTGGSGQFSYEWSNGDTTATADSLAAGTYTVTVRDLVSGCQQTDTVVVEDGLRITLTIGEEEGCEGETISIPVTADNFTDVTAFQFTIHPIDGTVATILGVTAGSIHPDIQDGFTSTLLAGNNLGVFWLDSSLTLPNETVLFNIDIQLGTAGIGASTAIVISSVPVNLQFTQVVGGNPIVVTDVDTISGLANITCGAPDLEIGGDIQTWNNPVPVPGVDVSLTGSLTANQTTGPTGTYLFGVATGDSTIVKCSKVTAGNAGITGADILLIKRHVLNIQPLTSPYQFVAADVSGEGNISILDYSRIQQLALALVDHITGSPDWKFIPKSYMFPPLPTPLSVPPPDSISHFPVDMDYLDDDFVAVRMGDVNGNVVPNFNNDDADDRSGSFRFRLDERSFQQGEIIEIQFKASDFVERSGYQMTLNFDRSVFEFAGFEPGVLPEMDNANFGTARISDGLLTTLWVTAVPMTVADGEVLFILKFKVLRNGTSLAEVLRPGSLPTRAEGYDRDGNPMNLDFEFTQGQNGASIPTFALYQNQPNPFNNLTTIAFRLPEAGDATLRVFNAAGQLVKMVAANFAEGYHELNFRRDEFGAPGVYYYELESAGNSDRKKMILME